jgi:hypothetical protein
VKTENPSVCVTVNCKLCKLCIACSPELCECISCNKCNHPIQNPLLLVTEPRTSDNINLPLVNHSVKKFLLWNPRLQCRVHNIRHCLVSNYDVLLHNRGRGVVSSHSLNSRIINCPLSKTAASIYWQLYSISGGRLLHATPGHSATWWHDTHSTW